jgi:hypothetical protein
VHPARATFAAGDPATSGLFADKQIDEPLWE